MRKSSIVLALVLAGCAGAAVPRATVPLVLDAPERERPRARAEIEAAGAGLPVALAIVERPRAAPERTADEVPFDAIRARYDEGDLEACLAALPSPERLDLALRDLDRVTPSRALFWRMACLRALGREDEARAAAAEHAARELPLPDDLGAANATAETMLRDAHRAAAMGARVPVAVRTRPAGAVIVVDGAAEAARSPSTLALRPGRHLVRVSLPAFATREVVLDVAAADTSPEIDLALERSEPEPAARALEARLTEGHALDDDVSLALLVVSLRSRALVLFSRDADRSRAALVTLDDDADHATVVRAERVGEAAWDLRGLLEDVLVRGSLMTRPPELYERPELWIAVAVAVAVGAAIAVGASIEPDVRTRITW